MPKKMTEKKTNVNPKLPGKHLSYKGDVWDISKRFYTDITEISSVSSVASNAETMICGGR